MSNTTTSTITVSIKQNGQTKQSPSYSITGIQAPPLETSVPVATPLVVANGIGTLKHTKLNLLYLLSDQLDCTVAFYTGTDGSTGLIGSPITIQAGIPLHWDPAIGTNPLGTSDCGSIKITATNYIKTVASGGTPLATDIHIYTSLTG